MVQIFKEYFIFCLDIIATAKIHGIAPKEDYSVCLFWIYTAFVGRYGDVVIILSQTYSAEIVFMMKEEKNKKNAWNKKMRIWTSERYIYVGNIIWRGFLSMQFCHQLCIVLLAHVKN